MYMCVFNFRHMFGLRSLPIDYGSPIAKVAFPSFRHLCVCSLLKPNIELLIGGLIHCISV